jgi:hypothetical protein
MIRKTFASLALASIIGCSSSQSFQPLGLGDGGATEAKLAAYAASTKYPTDMKPTTESRIGAIVNDDGKIKFLNFSDHPVHESNVWVNGNFVYHVDMIPAHGSAEVSYDQLFDTSGHSFASTKVIVNRIELQSNDQLYSIYSAQLR